MTDPVTLTITPFAALASAIFAFSAGAILSSDAVGSFFEGTPTRDRVMAAQQRERNKVREQELSSLKRKIDTMDIEKSQPVGRQVKRRARKPLLLGRLLPASVLNDDNRFDSI